MDLEKNRGHLLSLDQEELVYDRQESVGPGTKTVPDPTRMLYGFRSLKSESMQISQKPEKKV